MFSMPSSEVSMAPDGRVVWQRTEVADGTLYLPGKDADTDAKIAEFLLNVFDGEPLGEPNPKRRVIVPEQDEDIVLKDFISFTSLNAPLKGGLPSIRANVLLEAGLKMLRQPGPWRIQGNMVLGALVPNNLEGPVVARWAMVRAWPVPGVPITDYMSIATIDPGTFMPRITEAPKTPRLPGPADRDILFRTAIEIASGMRHFRDFAAKHDDKAENAVLERLPVLGPKRPIIGPKVIEQGLVTKLDIVGSVGFDF